MELHYFTYGQLMDTLTEINVITNNELFVKRIFSIIHHEVMKVSYLKAYNLETDSNHPLLENVEQIKNDVKSRILNYSYSLKDTGNSAQNLLEKIDENQKCLEEIKIRTKNLTFWQWEMRYYLWKLKKKILQERIPFTDVGNLFLYLYLQRRIGNSLSFRVELVRFSRHIGRVKEEENKKIGFNFKNPFRKPSPAIIKASNKVG